MTKIMKAMAGRRSFAGTRQAMNMGVTIFTKKSGRGFASRVYIRGFSSENPRDIAKRVKMRSK